MHVYIQSLIYINTENFKNSYPSSLYPWKICLHLLKVTRWGFLPARPPCFPHKSSREGHISYNVSALTGVNNSGRKNTQLTTWQLRRKWSPTVWFKSQISKKKLLKRVSGYNHRKKPWASFLAFLWHKVWHTSHCDSVSPFTKIK